MSKISEANKNLTGFCMRHLGRPTYHFENQDGISDEHWGGRGFYLLRIEEDGVDFLGADFDAAWKRVQVLKLEIQASLDERDRQLRAAARRRKTDELVGSAERGIVFMRRLMGSVDDLMDEGVRRARGLVDGAEMVRELFRPEPESRDGGDDAA